MKYIYRVVIDHKPDEPTDWKEWAWEWNGYLKTFGGMGDEYGEEPLAMERRWKEWRGGKREYYLSRSAAYRHMGRLTEHGVIARVVRCLVLQPGDAGPSPARKAAAVASLQKTVETLS